MIHSAGSNVLAIINIWVYGGYRGASYTKPRVYIT